MLIHVEALVVEMTVAVLEADGSSTPVSNDLVCSSAITSTLVTCPRAGS